MKHTNCKLLSALTIAGVLTLFAGAAYAEPKPTVCTAWSVLTGKAPPGGVGRVAVCTDRKRPVMLTRWVETEIPVDSKTDPVGGAVRRVIVGWR